MKKIDTFGLPVYMNEKDFTLSFDEDVECEQHNQKMRSQMRGLLYNDKVADEDDEVSYVFYMNIMKSMDKQVFNDLNYINGITVLMPGTMKGECRKNSGHYHCLVEGHILTYPEAYEILSGEAMFLLQKSTNFQEDELVVEECKAVFLKAGEKIVVPPFYAHCAINVGEEEMMFGNLAAPCPLDYEPIKKKHGFCYYVLKVDGKIVFVPNQHYNKVPQLKIMRTLENEDLGISFKHSMYEMLMKDPKCFAYLDHPEEYINEINALLIEI